MGRPKTIEDSRLLQAARRLFLEQGHAASTRDVAREAGISQSVLYQRFATKDELFFAAMLPPPPDLGVLLGDEADAERGAEAHLAEIAERLLGYFEEVAPLILHVVTHPAFRPRTLARAHDQVLHAELGEALAARIAALGRRGLAAPDDPRAAAEALVAAVHSMAMFHVHAGAHAGPPDHGRVRRLVHVLWRGLEPREAGGS